MRHEIDWIARINNIIKHGSGIGNSIPYFMENFPGSEIFAVNISNEYLGISKKQFGNSVNYMLIESLPLPMEDDYFDIYFSCLCFASHSSKTAC